MRLRLASQAKAGGANRDRTDDLKLAKLALSQLSYGPVVVLRSWWKWPASRSLRLPVHLRPSGFGGCAFACFASKGWWAWEDLNFRPHAYQARALTN